MYCVFCMCLESAPWLCTPDTQKSAADLFTQVWCAIGASVAVQKGVQHTANTQFRGCFDITCTVCAQQNAELWFLLWLCCRCNRRTWKQQMAAQVRTCHRGWRASCRGATCASSGAFTSRTRTARVVFSKKHATHKVHRSSMRLHIISRAPNPQHTPAPPVLVLCCVLQASTPLALASRR